MGEYDDLFAKRSPRCDSCESLVKQRDKLTAELSTLRAQVLPKADRGCGEGVPAYVCQDGDGAVVHHQPFILYVFKDGRKAWKKYDTRGQFEVCFSDLVPDEPEEKSIARMEEWILKVAESGMSYRRIDYVFRLTEMRMTNDGVEVSFQYYQQFDRRKDRGR